MKDLKAVELMNIDGCIVRDENGYALAKIREVDGKLMVDKMTACSIGTYFYILSYLEELGFEIHS